MSFELAQRLRTLPLLAAALLSASCSPSGLSPALPGSSGLVLEHPSAAPAPRTEPPPLRREFRAAWLSPVEHGAWPSKPGLPPAEQRAELVGLLDRAQEIGLNAIIFHVRTGADALYPTDRAPWSAYLTGKLGRAPEPAYDPVGYAIREAHARGLQFHAWFNPFRVSPPMADARHTAGHIATEHPRWVVRYGDQLWIDPGIPAARKAVLDAILEVVDRYDIDAVHLDDYFYPYLEEHAVRRRVRRGHRWRTVTLRETIPFPDDATWRVYGRQQGWTDRADWRRANIDAFVRDLYREVKARKPWVEVGISPFGIWRPGHPQGITGLDAYAEIFADSRRWLREGWLDYLAPQLYWPLGGNQHRFTRLNRWWQQQDTLGRHIWPGLYTVGATTGGSLWPAGEIEAQIDTLRALQVDSADAGHVHFRLKSLLPDARGAVGDLLRHDAYRLPAIPPASPWLGAAAPGPPTVSEALPGGTGDPVLPGPAGPALLVAPGDTVPVRWWVLQLRAADGRWTLRVRPGSLRRIPIALPDGSSPVSAAVTALSPTGVQGPRVLLELTGY